MGDGTPADREAVHSSTLSDGVQTWCVGDKLVYSETGEAVTVVEIHYNDHPPYYTIKMQSGDERQTVAVKLHKEREDPDAEAQVNNNSSTVVCAASLIHRKGIL